MIENYIKSFSTLYDLKSYIVYDIKNFPKKTGVYTVILTDEFNMIYNAYIYGFNKGKKAIIPKEEKKEEDESFYLEEWF